MSRFTTAALAFLAAALPAAAQFDLGGDLGGGFGAPADGANFAKASLIAEVDSVEPGKPFYAALKLEIAEGWHTYFSNPGTGQPPTIELTLPGGFTAGPLRFPAPHIRVTDYGGGASTTHDYSGVAIHPILITPPDDLAGESVTFSGAAKWQVCKESCVQEKAAVTLKLPVAVAGDAKPSAEAEAIKDAVARSEVGAPLWMATAAVDGEVLTVTAKVPDGTEVPVDRAHFVPSAQNIADADAEQSAEFDESARTLKLTLKSALADGAALPPIGGFLIVEPDAFEGGEPAAYYLATEGAEPEAMASGGGETQTGEEAPATTPSLGGAIPPNVLTEERKALIKEIVSWGKVELGETDQEVTAQSAEGGELGENKLLSILVLALLGGIVLNLMPCVFPVLAIKIMGFVQQAGEDRATIRKHGLVFGAGVVSSLWVLVGALLLVRAFVDPNVRWGFQLQNPVFLFFMIAVLFIFALSLAGVFEIGTSLTSVGSGAKKHGLSGSFFSGILAVVVATPCTGPFMAAALSYGLSAPAYLTFVVFTFLAIGIALPYVLLSFFPALIQKLPRPGPWMETFKQFMAFPLVATCVWLLWVFGKITGVDGMALIFAGLIVGAFGVWIYGRWVTPVAKPAKKSAGWIGLALCLGGMIWFGAQGWSQRAVAADLAPTVVKHGIEFEVFTPERLVQHRKKKRTVFIDFTADW